MVFLAMGGGIAQAAEKLCSRPYDHIVPFVAASTRERQWECVMARTAGPLFPSYPRPVLNYTVMYTALYTALHRAAGTVEYSAGRDLRSRLVGD